MTLFLLAACASPGTLESVAAALAADAESEAELPLRTGTAIVGVVAEACAAGEVEGHAFTGRLATAFGAGTAMVERGDADQTWTFAGVGLDGASGTLVVVTDINQQNLAIAYDSDAASLTAGFEVRACDATRAVVSGTGTWTSARGAVGLTLLGEAPSNGVTLAPPDAPIPSGGQARAASEEAGWSVLLDDAATLGADAPAWSGVASGADWSHAVAVPWP